MFLKCLYGSVVEQNTHYVTKNDQCSLKMNQQIKVMITHDVQMMTNIHQWFE